MNASAASPSLRDEDVLGSRLPVFAPRPHTLGELLLGAAQRFPERSYVVFPDREYTFATILGPIASMAATLRATYGVRKGDRVAIGAANCAGWALAFWATTLLGGITVALNGWWTGDEMAQGIALTTPKLVLGDRRRLSRLEGLVIDAPVVSFDGGLEDLLAPTGVAVPEVDIDEDDPFLILFTSGTTGRAKGALLSHRNNIAFIQSTFANAARSAGAQPAGSVAVFAPGGAATGPQPCAISAAPMFHVSGLNCQLVLAAATGMRIVYPPPGRWREDVFIDLCARHRVTSMALVPTQMWRILEHPDLDSYDLSSLKSIGGGSAVWAPELLRLLGERLPGVRRGLGLGYGMTETNGLGTSLRGPVTFEHPDSVGRPSPGVAVEVRDPATNEAVPDGVVGEVCLRSAANFLGYWGDPAATAAALDTDRWYHTGDFGRSVDGLLYLEGRRRDLIIRGGENIYPIEIENRLLEHPAIADAAVIGVAHPTLGHEVKAVVQRRAPLSGEDVRDWVGSSLAKFKVPAHVTFVESFPRNATGKILKHLLEEPGRSSGFVEEDMTIDVADRLALRALVDDYADACDSGRYADLGALFGVNGTLVLYDEGAVVAVRTGAAEVESAVGRGQRRNLASNHLVGGQHLERIEGDAATGTTTCLATRLYEHEGERRARTMAIRYTDVYVRDPTARHGWRFAERHVRPSWQEDRALPPPA